MPLKLKVPFEEKDEVKELGAWWNQVHKCWNIPDHVSDIDKFVKWIPVIDGCIVRKPYFLAVNTIACWRCGGVTPMIALGAKNYYEFRYEDENDPDNLRRHWRKLNDATLFSDAVVIDPVVTEYLHQRHPFYKLTYSKMQERSTYANTCPSCKVLQGEWHNHSDFGGAFFSDPFDKQPIQVKIIPLDIEFDYHIDADHGGMEYDYLDDLLSP
jgi:hypothetical protein